MSAESTWYPGYIGDLQPYRSHRDYERLYRPIAEELSVTMSDRWPQQVRAEYKRRIEELIEEEKATSSSAS